MHLRSRLAALVFCAGVTVAAGACSDAGDPQRARGAPVIAIAPLFSIGSGPAAIAQAAASIPFDRIRIVIVRPPADTLVDTTFVFPAAQAELTLQLTVPAPPGDVVYAAVQVRAGNLVLYSGSASATVLSADAGPHAPVVITLVPVGPGSAAQSVEVNPVTGLFPTSSPVAFAAIARSANGAPIADAVFAWSTDDETVGTVNENGTVQPTPKGGALRVRATTLNGTFGEATVVFGLPGIPAGLAIVAGNGQSGGAGTVLLNRLVVSVTDPFGAPVGNVPVTWTVVSGSASLNAVQSLTLNNGTANAEILLGPTLGGVVIRASAAGQHVMFSATVIPGLPAILQLVSGGGQTAPIGSVLSDVVVRVTDLFTNGVPGQLVTFAVGSGGGSITVLNATTDASGLAKARWTLGALVGTQTITATRAGLAGSPLTISATGVAGGSTGSWTGSYSWNCGFGIAAPGAAPLTGSATMQFTLVQLASSAQITGTVSYRGGTTGLTGTRYSQATFNSIGEVLSGTPAATGTIVQLQWSGTAQFTNNVFTGTQSGGTISGTTINGDSGTGCSAPTGPAGTFSISQQTP